jgi:transcription antitermination protein NusB
MIDKPVSLKARKKARVIALQAMYQWAMSGADLHTIEKEYAEHYDMSKVDCDYFHELLYDIPKRLNEIDDMVKTYIDREMHELNPVELAVLRIGCFELLTRLEIPYRVVIKEAVNLAKEFGATDGHKYVNGVLDKAAQHFRKIEYLKQ